MPTLPLALVLSLVIAGLLISIREAQDPLILGESEIRGLHVPFAGTIPDFRGFMPSQRNRIRSWRNMLAQHQQAVPLSFAFKKIRTRLIQIHRGTERSKIVAVHSHRPGEGKSYICGNLAASLSFLNGKVLLVDADSRMRSLTKALDLATHSGLNTLLKDGKAQLDKHLVNLGPRLDFLPAGEYALDSTELLQGANFPELIAELRKRYDFIVIDTPPWVSTSDAAIISSLCEINLVTARAGVTRVGDVNELVEEMASATEHTICLVLNGSRGISHLQYGGVG